MRGRLFVTGASALTLFSASALDIVWDLCPDDTPEHPSGDDCASVTLPLHPGSPELGDVTSFVRRFYPDSGPTGKSIWMIQGGPGYSSVGFAPIAEYWTQTGNTVYLMDARGVGLSSLLYCDVALQLPPFDTEDPDVIELFKTCHDQLAVKYGSVSQYFDTRHAALDMKSVIDAVNPDTVSIYATSVGAHYANVYMQLPGARVNAVILDSPVTTNRWKLENNTPWASEVAQDLLRLCASSSDKCAQYFGSQGHVPRLLMDAVIDGTLPCLRDLPWLSHKTLADYNLFMTGGVEFKFFLGPFWRRLQRCSESDVQQLNAFHARRVADTPPRPIVPAPSDGSPPPFQEYSYGLAINLSVNELYSASASPLSYEQQLLIDSRAFARSDVDKLVAFAARPVGEGGVARYNASEEARVIGEASVPVLITQGTLDANVPQGHALWLRDALGPSATLVEVPFAAHTTLSGDAPCVIAIMTDFIDSVGASMPDTSCLADNLPPDFDGGRPESAELLMAYFGTADTWNSAGESDGGGDGDSSDSLSDGAIIGISVGCGVAALGAAFWTGRWTGRRSAGLLSKGASSNHQL